jgi:hypothetical protein
MASIFHIGEVHIGGVHTKKHTKSMEKNPNQKPLSGQRFGTHTKYIIIKGNPSSTTTDESVVVATFAQTALLQNHYNYNILDIKTPLKFNYGANMTTINSSH